ncbi:hypothetical protein EDB85DRAFT_1902764 [Lactarius pseudohatsudake]|nr:hypothetical protein EDB85DRAFT_1902764 [Lactarius pseudohatsudake]
MSSEKIEARVKEQYAYRVSVRRARDRPKFAISKSTWSTQVDAVAESGNARSPPSPPTLCAYPGSQALPRRIKFAKVVLPLRLASPHSRLAPAHSRSLSSSSVRVRTGLHQRERS